MENQEKLPLWQKIIQVCILLLPLVLIGIMLLLKQSNLDYEASEKYFIFIGLAMALVGLFLRLTTDSSYGQPLVYGGVLVFTGAPLFLGSGKTTNPVPVEPIQTETFAERTRSFILSFATVEQVHRFGIVLAVITGALVLYFAVKFILSIIWEDMYSQPLYLTNTIALGLPFGFLIYVLCIV